MPYKIIKSGSGFKVKTKTGKKLRLRKNDLYTLRQAYAEGFHTARE